MLKSSITLVSIIFFLILESAVPFFQYQRKLNIRNSIFNFLVGAFNVVVTTFSIGLLYTLIFEQPLHLSLFESISFPLWIAAVISFFVLELYIYSWHRFAHSKYGWWMHKFHHEDSLMSTSTAFRFHILEVIFSNLPRIFIIWIFGIPFEIFLGYEIVFTVQNIIQHSNITYPQWMESTLSRIVITPSLHKVHHSQNIEDSNSNFATISTFWDSIFKSYRARKYPEYKKIQLGVK